MKRIITALALCLPLILLAQERAFWKEIRAFKTSDSVDRPPKNAIVFVGSSSFRMWRNIQQDFPDHKIINRGFGGSSLPHVLAYADEIIITYQPKQVVVYCGENDFMTDTVTSDIVVDRFKTLFHLLRKQIPKAEILFVSMKPSPSRQRLMPEIHRANQAIRSFLEKNRKGTYVNVWDAMLDKNGNPRKELFLQDMLHMNEKGYAIWQEILAPYLKK